VAQQKLDIELRRSQFPQVLESIEAMIRDFTTAIEESKILSDGVGSGKLKSSTNTYNSDLQELIAAAKQLRESGEADMAQYNKVDTSVN